MPSRVSILTTPSYGLWRRVRSPAQNPVALRAIITVCKLLFYILLVVTANCFCCCWCCCFFRILLYSLCRVVSTRLFLGEATALMRSFGNSLLSVWRNRSVLGSTLFVLCCMVVLDTLHYCSCNYRSIFFDILVVSWRKKGEKHFIV